MTAARVTPVLPHQGRGLTLAPAVLIASMSVHDTLLLLDSLNWAVTVCPTRTFWNINLFSA